MFLGRYCSITHERYLYFQDETAVKYIADLSNKNRANVFDYKSWLRDFKEDFEFRVNFKNYDSIFAMLKYIIGI